MTRICNSCKASKPLSEFYKDTRAKNGVGGRCKTCDLEYQQGRKLEKHASHLLWYAKNGTAWNDKKREGTKEKRLRSALERASTLGVLDDKRTAAWRKNRASRMLRKVAATPTWVDATHRMKISVVYALTQQLQEATGSIYHVDHIVPLHSNLVCGLHVWWNLQPLSEKNNILKNDAFDPALFPDQGEVAFPSGGGFVVHATLLQKVEQSDE